MHFKHVRNSNIPSKHDLAKPTLKEETGILPNQTAYKCLTWLVGQQGPRATPAERIILIVCSIRSTTTTPFSVPPNLVKLCYNMEKGAKTLKTGSVT